MSGFKSKTLRDATTVRFTEPRPVKPTGILHFTIGVSDLDRARRFYEDVLGCTYWRHNDTTVFMRAGEDYFVLSKSDASWKLADAVNDFGRWPWWVTVLGLAPLAVPAKPCRRTGV